MHNAIIGPKGKLVQSVMTECGGVRIQFPPGDSKKDEVKLHGPKDDVEKAKKMLEELAEEQVRMREREREGRIGIERDREREEREFERKRVWN